VKILDGPGQVKGKGNLRGKPMNSIKACEILYKRKVGTWGRAPVLEVALKGGLFLLYAAKDGRMEPIGSGSHRALARHIAKKKTNGELEITELEKSEYVNPEHFKEFIPYYEALTEAMPSFPLKK
jgi:hypothetical protein